MNLVGQSRDVRLKQIPGRECIGGVHQGRPEGARSPSAGLRLSPGGAALPKGRGQNGRLFRFCHSGKGTAEDGEHAAGAGDKGHEVAAAPDPPKMVAGGNDVLRTGQQH